MTVAWAFHCPLVTRCPIQYEPTAYRWLPCTCQRSLTRTLRLPSTRALPSRTLAPQIATVRTLCTFAAVQLRFPRAGTRYQKGLHRQRPATISELIVALFLVVFLNSWSFTTLFLAVSGFGHVLALYGADFLSSPICGPQIFLKYFSTAYPSPHPPLNVEISIPPPHPQVFRRLSPSRLTEIFHGLTPPWVVMAHRLLWGCLWRLVILRVSSEDAHYIVTHTIKAARPCTPANTFQRWPMPA